jgi:uncharacterized protein (TIGR03905 family)
MMKAYDATPRGVCSRAIHFELDGGKLHNVRFVGGCPGNLLAIGKLLEGADAESAVRLLKGNKCGAKATSCADQLAVAVETALAEGKEG